MMDLIELVGTDVAGYHLHERDAALGGLGAYEHAGLRCVRAVGR